MGQQEFVDDETLQEFIAESLDHLSRFENQRLDVEAGGADRDQEVLNALFRAVHSIKGGGGLLGLTPITSLAHQMENILGRVRERELVLTAPDVDVIFQAAAILHSMLGHVDSRAAYDLSTIGRALERLAAAECAIAETVTTSPTPNAEAGTAAPTVSLGTPEAAAPAV
jgi:two-component system chemotaxis sensor kinase CheA